MSETLELKFLLYLFSNYSPNLLFFLENVAFEKSRLFFSRNLGVPTLIPCDSYSSCLFPSIYVPPRIFFVTLHADIIETGANAVGMSITSLAMSRERSLRMQASKALFFFKRTRNNYKEE
jgi:hypothetical protein